MMKFEIAMKEMKDVVKKIEKSVTKKAALSILETVLVKQENDQLAFIASNMEEELHIYKNIFVSGNDSFCIKLDNLKKIIKLKADILTITYDSEHKNVLVSTGKKIVTFPSMWDAAEDFPLMKDIKEPEEKFFTSNYLEFFNMMEKLYVYLKDSDEYNKAMSYYNFNANKNRITALDGHRIGMCKPSNEVGTFNIDSDVKEVNLNREVWIKLKNCIAKESKGEQNIIIIASKDKKTYITGNDFKMIVRESGILYFDVDKILLSESDLMMVNVNTSELNESAEYNISFHGKGSKKPMVMKFIGNNIMSYMATEEEKDYSTYPKEKLCDYDYMAIWIREQGYEPKTDMENLISNIFCFYEMEIGDHVSDYDTENGNFDGTYSEAAKAYVMDNGGLVEFDYIL